MLYKLVIVDDEAASLDGIGDMIDWSCTGYELAAKLKNGRDAINFISKNKVHVVLSDIKMPLISGLELAEHIHKNYSEIKVILISAYRDFEYARSAIKYNVEHYLLKPFSLQEITDTFQSIKNDLDQIMREKICKKRKEGNREKIFSALRDQFVIDLAMGTLKDNIEIEKRANLIELEIDIRTNPCCLVIIQSYIYQKGQGHLLTDDFFQIETSSLNSFNSKIWMHFTILGNNMLVGLVVSCNKSGHEKFKTLVEKKLGHACNIVAKRYFNSLLELAAEVDSIVSSSYFNISQNEHLRKKLQSIGNTQSLLYSHIVGDNYSEIMKLFNCMIEKFEDYNIKLIQNLIIEFLTVLIFKLKEHNINIYFYNDCIIDYRKILNTTEIGKIVLYVRSVLGKIIERANGIKNGTEHQVIDKAKRFIEDNYNQDISLNKVADYICLSPIYFSRLFKEKSGENYVQFVKNIRLKRAVKLLNNHNYKVYEVSEMVGFKDVKYFYKLFKRHYKCTPKEYRRNSLSNRR